MLDLLATPLVERRHADSLLVDEPKEQSDFAAAKKPCVETVAGRIHVHGQESAGRRGGGLQTRLLSSLQPRALNYACMSAPPQRKPDADWQPAAAPARRCGPIMVVVSLGDAASIQQRHSHTKKQ